VSLAPSLISVAFILSDADEEGLDRWYIYYTAGNSANLDGQRMHVLKGKH
jgi:hypothetical protein